jgi:predicted dehydrogenase
MAGEPIRVGLIGAGAAVRRLHLPALAALADDVRAVGVWSRTPDNARALADRHPVGRCCADYREMLADRDVDAVLIAVPIERNAAILIEALAAGKHVLAEKPIAATTAEARDVLRAGARSSRVVVIGENFRYREDVLRAKELVESGAVGRVQCFQVSMLFDLRKEFRREFVEKGWRRDPKHPGGLVVDAGVHVVASLREVLGDVRDLYARTLHRAGETTGPSGLLMQLTLTSGAAGHYFTCHAAQTDRETVFDLAAYGEGGSLWVTEGTVEWTEGGGTRRTYRPEGYDRGYRNQWRNFCGAIRGEEGVYSTPEKAYGDLLVLEAALHSARLGRPVELAAFEAGNDSSARRTST